MSQPKLQAHTAILWVVSLVENTVLWGNGSYSLLIVSCACIHTSTMHHLCSELTFPISFPQNNGYIYNKSKKKCVTGNVCVYQAPEGAGGV